MDKELTQLFGRVGGKARIRTALYRYFPKDFTTYVEPFIGAGSVMLGYKFKPDQKVVINDKDKQLIAMWRILKKGPSGDINKYNTSDLGSLTRLRDKKGGSELDRLVSYMINSRNTFGNIGKGKIYKTTNPVTKLKKLDEYKEKLKNVTILNSSYESVISRYNRPGTFFYFDPPYEKSGDLYKHGGDFDFVKFAQKLKGIKGKFMLSINDSKNIRDLFKGFKQRRITVGALSNSDSGPGSSARKELIITNY